MNITVPDLATPEYSSGGVVCSAAQALRFQARRPSLLIRELKHPYGREATARMYSSNLCELSIAGVAQQRIPCHLGHIGGLLWVKEPYRVNQMTVDYVADELRQVLHTHKRPLVTEWIPASQMACADSRTTLIITELRIKRIQEITWEDALMDGLVLAPGKGSDPDSRAALVSHYLIHTRGQAQWDANQWQWLIQVDVINFNVMDVLSAGDTLPTHWHALRTMN